jgi:hypothetical protein
MQQPTNVIDMMTVCNKKTISPTSCEKITLFCHAILLPKILLSYTFRPSIIQSTALLALINDHFQHRRSINAPDSPSQQYGKNKEDMIETP